MISLRTWLDFGFNFYRNTHMSIEFHGFSLFIKYWLDCWKHMPQLISAFHLRPLFFSSLLSDVLWINPNVIWRNRNDFHITKWDELISTNSRKKLTNHWNDFSHSFQQFYVLYIEFFNFNWHCIESLFVRSLNIRKVVEIKRLHICKFTTASDAWERDNRSQI